MVHANYCISQLVFCVPLWLWIYRMPEGLDLHIAKVVFQIVPQIFGIAFKQKYGLFERLCLESVQSFNCLNFEKNISSVNLNAP